MLPRLDEILTFLEGFAPDEAGRCESALLIEFVAGRPVPIAPYISREYYEREQALIFRKVWLNVALVEQIPKPGEYFVKELEVCNTSVLIVRGKDGLIRAFHNMCTHRGNKLAPDASGNCPGLFTCKFHGWAFGRFRAGASPAPVRSM
jgi:nitrite reductase/ring-hydroxylating ferredoxin subunit